jgi:AGZA family xanthine/uracil permease-like MFS transporter
LQRAWEGTRDADGGRERHRALTRTTKNEETTMQAGTPGGAARLWVAGDLNGFFGLFTNVLLNVIVLTTLCLYVVQLPPDTVYGRVLPALGIALPLGNLFYAYLAWQLAKQEGRSDVTAMPYGPSVPHMFIVVLVIMLPTYLATKDPMLAYQAGLAWCFIIGVIVLLGAFVGPWIRRVTPRAAMLGTLAGISIAFISMRPAFQMWELPWIGMACFAIVLIAWTGNIRLPGGVPGGLAAVIVGALIGWIAAALGWSDYMKGAEVSKAFSSFGLHLPWFSGAVFAGLASIGPLLATAIPLGIYNFTEAMNNVESASAAGDNYNLRKILLADGIGAILGSLLGSPFPPAVYIGHPGWKSVGGRIGYSLATGLVIALVCFLGLTALLLNLIPLVAILPILLYIGLVIGAQAFQASPANHAPAVVLAIIPNVAEWAKISMDSALQAGGTSADKVGFAALAQVGVVYQGMASLGSGSVLAGMVLGAMAAFIIDHKLKHAAVAAFAGAVFAYIGLIHGPQLGWAVSPLVSLGYAMFGAICLLLDRGQPARPAAA